jgi:hypothetical protein
MKGKSANIHQLESAEKVTTKRSKSGDQRSRVNNWPSTTGDLPIEPT